MEYIAIAAAVILAWLALSEMGLKWWSSMLVALGLIGGSIAAVNYMMGLI